MIDHQTEAQEWLDIAKGWYRQSDEDTGAFDAGQLAAAIAQVHVSLFVAQEWADLIGEQPDAPKMALPVMHKDMPAHEWGEIH